MNSYHTIIKDITTSNKRSLLRFFEKGNKYDKNESRNSCHDATYTRLNARSVCMTYMLVTEIALYEVIDQ